MTGIATALAGEAGRRLKKATEPETVASVAAFRDGKLLMGQRRDDGTWCCPGGHLEAGENPEAGARRELREETGLQASALKKLGSRRVKNGEILVHSFAADVAGEPSSSADPDDEFSRFRWVNPAALPDDVAGNLHNEPDVTLQLLEQQPHDDEAPYLTLLEES